MLVLSLVVAAGAAARLAQLERARRGRRSGSPAKRGRIGRNFTTAGWAALAASIPLTIAMLYGGLDTTPADVDLRFATPLRRVLSDGEITIKFSCSELCADDTFNLHGDGGPAPDPRFVESLTSSKYTEPWEGRRGSWTLKLTRPQRRWLRSRLHKGYPWLEIWVESRPGNFTKTRLNFPFS